jgi:hypothetical protein
LANANCIAASSSEISRITPPVSFEASAITEPNPPNSTLVIERFIALHISTDRINPEKPSSVPAMISTLLPSTNPVAAAASPA